ncbi:response regulator [Streptomyces sp. NPDC055952]|uniref:response regulator n=1 Tax=Streptomyces sp. NPDC055952 TaxID=3345663 RepID=UPI0035DFBB13
MRASLPSRSPLPGPSARAAACVTPGSSRRRRPGIRRRPARDAAAHSRRHPRRRGAPPSRQLLGSARNGVEAVQRAVRHCLDAVLMDIRMPGMDGVAVAALLRRRLPRCEGVVASPTAGIPPAPRIAGKDAVKHVIPAHSIRTWRRCSPRHLIRKFG